MASMTYWIKASSESMVKLTTVDLIPPELFCKGPMLGLKLVHVAPTSFGKFQKMQWLMLGWLWLNPTIHHTLPTLHLHTSIYIVSLICDYVLNTINYVQLHFMCNFPFLLCSVELHGRQHFVKLVTHKTPLLNIVQYILGGPMEGWSLNVCH